MRKEFLGMRKPVIALRKENEGEVVNAKTYWSLTMVSSSGSYPSYELRVKYDAITDRRTLISHDAETRDELELLTQEEWDRRKADIVANENANPDEIGEWMSERWAVMDKTEARYLALLNATWEAFVLLFEPAYTF